MTRDLTPAEATALARDRLARLRRVRAEYERDVNGMCLRMFRRVEIGLQRDLAALKALRLPTDSGPTVGETWP